MSSSPNLESDDELFDIPPEAIASFSSPFTYTDSLLVTGVLRAVVDKDLEKLKYMIEKERCPTINDNHGNTPLHIAAANNSADIAKYLLSLENEIADGRNFYGETPLLMAASRGHLEVVKTLLADGYADVSIANLEGVTPLHKATHSPEIAHLLIQYGANVNAQDGFGETPLHAAVSEISDSLETAKCFEVVCMLLFYKADASIQCDSARTAFLKAIFHHRDDIQSILLDYIADFDACVHGGITTLGWALIHESPFVEYILKAGASVNYKNSSSNAVVACLQTSNIKNFKLIWKKFKHQKLDDDKTYLDVLIDYLSNDELFEYLQAIIDSNNLKPLFKNFDTNPIFNVLLKNKPRQSWLNTTCNLIYLYLCEGYHPDVWLLFRVFWTFGYSELFYLCLHLDFKFYADPSIMAGHIPLLLYRPLVSMPLFKKFVALRLLDSRPVHIKEYLPYLRLLPHYSQDYRHAMVLPHYSQDYRHAMVLPLHDMDLLMQIPSLLELSRNQAREYLAFKFLLDTSKKYICFIKTLNLPTHCKDILIFKRPVYFFDK